MTYWPHGGYPSGNKPVSELKPPPANITSKAPSSPVETTDGVSGPELHPRNSIALESESKVGTNEAREARWIKVLNLYHLGTGTVLGDWQRERLDAIMAHADAEHAALTDKVARFDRERQGFKAAIAQRDAEVERLTRVTQIIMATADDNLAAKDVTIDRLWRQLNEATNVPDHNDPEFGFDKTAALSEPGPERCRGCDDPHCKANQ